ncbi:MAG TPA: hypothetical protein VM101_15070 [Flavitalea sp.]|nr:hypothetical protein [Flavitalea sp.]
MKLLTLTPSFLRIILLMMASIFIGRLSAQEVSYFQYRKVPPSKIDEFIKRETTYWSKVAEKGIATGQIEFWGLFEKVSGGSTETPNFLFVNTFKDIDEAMKGEMWDPTKLFPGIPFSKIETNSISTTTNTLFTAPRNWEQSAKFTKPGDVKFVVINYHHASDPDGFIALEQKYWQPFIKGEMEAGRTSQIAWGNEKILSPSSGKDGASTISIDLFPSFKDALAPSFAKETQFPVDGLNELQKFTSAPRDIEIYRVVKIVAKN